MRMKDTIEQSDSYDNINASIRSARTNYFSFLLIAFTIASLIVSSSHLDKAKQSAVQLPLVNIEVDIPFFVAGSSIIMVTLYGGLCLRLFSLLREIRKLTQYDSGSLKPLDYRKSLVSKFSDFNFLYMENSIPYGYYERNIRIAFFITTFAVLPISVLALLKTWFLPVLNTVFITILDFVIITVFTFSFLVLRPLLNSLNLKNLTSYLILVSIVMGGVIALFSLLIARPLPDLKSKALNKGIISFYWNDFVFAHGDDKPGLERAHKTLFGIPRIRYLALKGKNLSEEIPLIKDVLPIDLVSKLQTVDATRGAWEVYRRQHMPISKILTSQLAFSDIKNTEMSGLNFNGTNFNAASFNDVKAFGSIFSDSSFQNTYIAISNFDGSIFENSKFISSDILMASCSYCDFSYTVIQGTSGWFSSVGSDFSYSFIENSSLAHRDFSAASFASSLLVGNQFSNANMSFSNFYGAKLILNDFRYLKIRYQWDAKEESLLKIFDERSVPNIEKKIYVRSKHNKFGTRVESNFPYIYQKNPDPFEEAKKLSELNGSVQYPNFTLLSEGERPRMLYNSFPSHSKSPFASKKNNPSDFTALFDAYRIGSSCYLPKIDDISERNKCTELSDEVRHPETLEILKILNAEVLKPVRDSYPVKGFISNSGLGCMLALFGDELVPSQRVLLCPYFYGSEQSKLNRKKIMETFETKFVIHINSKFEKNSLEEGIKFACQDAEEKGLLYDLYISDGHNCLNDVKEGIERN